jgi:hypothetical protein
MQIDDKVKLKQGSDREFIIHLIVDGYALLKKAVDNSFKITDWVHCSELKLVL